MSQIEAGPLILSAADVELVLDSSPNTEWVQQQHWGMEFEPAECEGATNFSHLIFHDEKGVVHALPVKNGEALEQGLGNGRDYLRLREMSDAGAFSVEGFTFIGYGTIDEKDQNSYEISDAWDNIHVPDDDELEESRLKKVDLFACLSLVQLAMLNSFVDDNLPSDVFAIKQTGEHGAEVGVNVHALFELLGKLNAGEVRLDDEYGEVDENIEGNTERSQWMASLRLRLPRIEVDSARKASSSEKDEGVCLPKWLEMRGADGETWQVKIELFSLFRLMKRNEDELASSNGGDTSGGPLWTSFKINNETLKLLEEDGPNESPSWMRVRVGTSSTTQSVVDLDMQGLFMFLDEYSEEFQNQDVELRY